MEQAYRLNPKNDKIATEYAGLLFMRGDFFSVKKVLEEILSRNPSYGPGRKLAALAAELGKKSEFADIIERLKEKSEHKAILRQVKEEADEKNRPSI
ncbi:MAG: hypothetical protein BWK80_14995 [Desulfobacteraceae bacterium IS3]|nr:MAG: hypothetical protein BWK80_14995 [Desulfobacteraceae bacterium IS3]